MGRFISADVEILASIGRGGRGEVFKGHFYEKGAPLPRLVAIKFRHGIRPNSEDAKAFRKEVRRWSKRNCDQIVKYIGTRNTFEGLPFIIMEFVEGQTLRELLCASGGSGLRQDESLLIAKEIAEAIQYLSTRREAVSGSYRQLVHGDLSPRNIMITPDQRVKVIDLDEARFTDPFVTKTLSDIMATLEYSAPEVMKGKVSKISELFSLGAILFEMLTGKKLKAEMPDLGSDVYSTGRIASRQAELTMRGVDPALIEIILGLTSESTRDRDTAFQKLRAMPLMPKSAAPSTEGPQVQVAASTHHNRSIGRTFRFVARAAAAAAVILLASESQVGNFDPPVALIGPAIPAVPFGPPVPESTSIVQEPRVLQGLRNREAVGRSAGKKTKDSSDRVSLNSRKPEAASKPVPEAPAVHRLDEIGVMLLSTERLSGGYSYALDDRADYVSIEEDGVLNSDICGRPWMKISRVVSQDNCSKKYGHCGSMDMQIVSETADPSCMKRLARVQCKYYNGAAGLKLVCRDGNLGIEKMSFLLKRLEVFHEARR